MADKAPAGVMVYPTCVSDVLNIKSPFTIDQVQVMDMTGKPVLTELIGGCSATVQTSSWNNGIYLVKIIAGSEVIVRRVIKKEL